MKFLFLANIDPKLQLSVLEQVQRPVLVACDTMNYWIDSKRETLKTTLGRVDALLINEAETRQLADEPNLIKAGQRILSWGPKTIVIKRGEYGVLMINSESIFGAPAFPLESVVDPTGAGDSFAGGFMGYLAAAQRIGRQCTSESHCLRFRHGVFQRHLIRPKATEYASALSGRGTFSRV